MIDLLIPSFQETIRNELALGDVDFNVKRDSNGRPGDAVKIVRSSTLRSLKLGNGDVLYITPVEGTRCGFIDVAMLQLGKREAKSLQSFLIIDMNPGITG